MFLDGKHQAPFGERNFVFLLSENRKLPKIVIKQLVQDEADLTECYHS